MDRLTYRGKNGKGYVRNQGYYDKVYLNMAEVAERLTAYEDTGLEPEEITTNMKMFAAYRHVCCGLPPEKVSELVKAEQKRREGCEWCRSCCSCDEYGDCPHQGEMSIEACDHYEPRDSFCRQCGRDLRGDSQ